MMLLAAAIVLSVGGTTIAAAQDGEGRGRLADADGRAGGGGVSDGSQLEVNALDEEPPRESTTGDNGPHDCTWHLAIPDDARLAVYDEFGERRLSETGRWWGTDEPERCGGGFFVVPDGGEIDLVGLRERARDAVVPGEPAARFPELIWVAEQGLEMWLVQAPLWFWLDEEYWTTYTASVSAGRAAATGTASPSLVIWSPGDAYDPGQVVVCEGEDVTRAANAADYEDWAFGAGVEREWDGVHGVYDAGSAPTSCFYTYHHDSADRPERSFVVGTEAAFETEVVIVVGAVEIGRWVLEPIVESTERSIHVGQSFALAAD